MPAGFHFEVFYGATATAVGSSNGDGNDFWIPAANVAYRLPIGPTITAANPLTNLDGDICLYSATLTGDWSLTKNLTWKVGFQWQGARGTNDEIFPKEDYRVDNQILLGTQNYYAF